jgi:glycosyltransferase involved in cell wall biosynthesis
VAHIGTVYPTSTPRYYFDAIDSLPDAARDRIETHFVGRITDQERPYFANRKAHIVEHGFVPQQEAIRFMEEADVLLLVMTDPNFASGKIYEYLATGKPILAISPAGGEVEDVIWTTGAGWVISPDDPEALRAVLMNILDRYSKGELAGQSRRDRVEAYARPQLAEQFAGYVKRLLGNHPAALT